MTGVRLARLVQRRPESGRQFRGWFSALVSLTPRSRQKNPICGRTQNSIRTGSEMVTGKRLMETIDWSEE
jgi:hypothetical protein